MIFIALLASTLIFYLTRAKKSVLLDPLTIFFVGLLYYGYFIPVTMSLIGRFDLPFLDGELSVTDSDLTAISIILVLGHLAFSVGYRVFVPRSFADEVYEYAKDAQFRWSDGGGAILAILFFLTIALCVIVFPTELANVMSGYAGKILTRYEQSTFAALFNLTSMIAAVFMVRTVLFGRAHLLLGLSFVFIQMVWAILTFSKEPMVLGALIALATAARFAPERQLQLLFAGIVSGVGVLLTLVPSFARYRYTGQIELVALSDINLPLLFSDAAGPFSSFVLAVRGFRAELPQLWESFILWIPRGVWPSRPLDAAEEFARAVMPGWQPGYGLGFSPFGEARIRFGVALSPLLLLLAGLSFSYLQRQALRLVPATLATALMLVVHGYILFVMHRGAFSAVFTNMAQFWLPFLVLSLLLNFILRFGQRTAR